MQIIEQLKNNKGTISSELSKRLALEVLSGNMDILSEAIELTSYELKNKKEKNIRSGAAKIVEVVAMEKPELVSPYLEELLPALEADEPQTRWMIIRTMGICAVFNEVIAGKALEYAKMYIRNKKEGELCLVSSADLYLGDYGAMSRKNTEKVFSILLESTDNIIMNEHDWLLEAFTKIIPNLLDREKATVLSFAREYQNHSRKTTQKRVEIIEHLCKD
ncbi:MAG: hypothetical protein GX638_18265 [Crenarchaeota archaeon]|nr:hypothetical protein [Thermoproteota archaeon]